MKKVTLLTAALALLSMSLGVLADDITDLWDIHQGSIVTGTWVAGLYPGSDARDMFGGEFGTIEAGHTVFPDAGWLPGNSVWVSWKTPSVVEVGRFVLSVAADGDYPATYNRAIRGFSLYTSDNGNDWNQVYDSGLLSAPLGTYVNGIYNYTCDYTFANPVSSQFFKADFVCDTTTGPRIIELDGYAPVPEPSSIMALLGGLTGLIGLRRRKA